MPNVSLFIREETLDKVDEIVARNKNTDPNYSRSIFVTKAIKDSVSSLEIQPDFHFHFLPDNNYCFCSKTRWGKTKRIQHLVAGISDNKPITIITPANPEKDYPELLKFGFEVFPVSYSIDATTGMILLGDALSTFSRSGLIQVAKQTHEAIIAKKKIIVYLKFTDLDMEKLFVKSILERLLQSHYQTETPRLLIIEEATRYQDGAIQQIASQGLKLQLQCCIATQFVLKPEIANNFVTILGWISPQYIKDDPMLSQVTSAVVNLSPHEFLYFNNEVGKWFKLLELPE
jgi:hypothetical protein